MRRRLLLGAAAALSTTIGAACGDSDAADETLPPIRTTTTSTTTTTTIPTEKRFYDVKRGDTLTRIAAGFNVSVASIVELNGLENADDIQAGQRLEIPSGVVVIDTLPPVVTSSTAAP